MAHLVTQTTEIHQQHIKYVKHAEVAKNTAGNSIKR